MDATFNAIHTLVLHEAEESVRLSEQGRAATLRGADPDTPVASPRPISAPSTS